MLLKLSQLWECKGNEEKSLYDYSNESIEINIPNTNDEMINHDDLESNFHDVWVECNGTLYWVPID